MKIYYPSVVYGFHGCDKRIGEKVLSGEIQLKKSNNEYDWLGHGIYFWESNPNRALEYAKLIQKYPERATEEVKNPFVIGAIIDLGRCLDLLESESLRILKRGYEILADFIKDSGQTLPVNKPIGKEKDLLLRPLDCTVIEFVNKLMKDTKEGEYDSVRGAFFEGKDLYPNAGFKEKNHIQICIRNHDCIIAYFRVKQIIYNSSL